jgi:16S rRNA (uracil1498-N3)-methyltransferase
MEIRRFYSAYPVVNGRIIISGDELFHLKTVNRARSGDRIQVFDGMGNLYDGSLSTVKANEAVMEIARREGQEKSGPTVIIAPSLIKKKAMSVMVEKLTEMGVDEIRPVLFTRTDEKYHPSMLEKWRRIAIQSLKVNGKLWPTEIFPPVDIRGLIDFANGSGIADGHASGILLHAEGAKGPFPVVQPPVISIIGPPGDFFPGERELLVKNGFIQYNINDGILKTETAAISIAAILKGAALDGAGEPAVVADTSMIRG